MKQYFGNYLGICINNADPQRRGRVQVFIPHIMPALFSNWNQAEQDINITCVGDNLPEGLTSDIREKLIQILPWADAASPIVGMSSPGTMTNGNSAGGAAGGAGGAAGGAAGGSSSSYSGGDGGSGAADPGSVFDQSPSTILPADAPPAVPPSSGPLKFPTRGNEGNGKESMPGGIGGNWAGSANVLSDLLPGGFNYLPSSTKRGYPTSGSYPENTGSDHNWTNTNAYAIDLASRTFGSGLVTKGSSAYNKATQCAIGIYNNIRSQLGQPPISEWNSQIAAQAARKIKLPNGYRTQLLWWSDGAHRNHIHFGVKYEGPVQERISESASPPPVPASASKDGGLAANDKTVPANVASSTQKHSEAGDEPQFGATTMSLGGTQAPPDPKPISIGATTYGGITTDFTTFLDLKPEQRPPEVARMWESKGYSIAKNEASLASRGIKTGTLNMSDTAMGAYGRIIEDLTCASTRVPGGSVLKLTNPDGTPYNPTGKNPSGTYPVKDTGNAKLAYNKPDLYTQTPELYKGLDSVRVSIVSLGTQYGKQYKRAQAQFGDGTMPMTGGSSIPAPGDGPIGGASEGGAMGGEGGGGGTTMVNRTSDHGPLVVKNTNDMPNGLFAYPSPGAMLWVFFREGNPLFPVYFAASYGAAEWSSAYRQGSKAPGMAFLGEGSGGGFSHGTEFKPTPAGGISSTYSVDPTNPTNDQKSIMMYNDDGSNIFLGTGLVQHFSQHDKIDYVKEDRFNTTMGYKEAWVQGDSNTVILGDCYIKIGDISQRAVNAMDKIKQYTQEIQEPLLKPNPPIGGGGEGGGGGSSGSPSAPPATPLPTAPAPIQKEFDARMIMNKIQPPDPGKYDFSARDTSPPSYLQKVPSTSYQETRITTIKVTSGPVI